MRKGPHTVVVPATSANLGPGYDSLGIALGLADEVTAEVTTSGFDVTVEGEGADTVAAGESHLVVVAMARTVESLGSTLPGVKLYCRNRIPHARGLGSSSAAIVAGVYLAHAVTGIDIESDAALHKAAEIEGHPDNVAPCIYGWFTIAYSASEGAEAVSLRAHPSVRTWAYVPSHTGLTAQARSALPHQVPHADAAFNVARSALLVHALTADPQRLWEATQDRLHQSYRATGMKASWELMRRLREAGYAAMISGAGPTVLVMGAHGDPRVEVTKEFTCRELSISDGARLRLPS